MAETVYRDEGITPHVMRHAVFVIGWKVKISRDVRSWDLLKGDHELYDVLHELLEHLVKHRPL